MKNASVLMLLMSFAITAAAADPNIVCKTEGTNAGFQAVVSDSQVKLTEDGTEVATLVIVNAHGGGGGDQQSTTRYEEKMTNGYALTLISGGISGRTTAIIYRGGFFGFQPIANLNECK